MTAKPTIRTLALFKAFFSKLAIFAYALCLGLPSAKATAFTIDLTNAASTVNINGGLFNYSNTSSGSGAYTSLYRIQANTTESGYNYAGTPKPFDQSGGVGVFHVDLRNLPGVIIGGVQYVQFHFDANNTAGLTFTDFRVFQHSDPANLDTQILVTTEAGLSTLGTLVYDMLGTNTGGANSLRITAFNSGSGTDDMTINIPVANFNISGPSMTDDIYLFAKMTGSDGGFEEFAYFQNTGASLGGLVPEAHPIWGGGAMVAGLIIFGLVRQRRTSRTPTATA